MPAAADIWYLIILGGSLTAVAQYALVKAYTIADASFVQPFDNIKLPLNVAISFLVFGTFFKKTALYYNFSEKVIFPKTSKNL